MTNKTLLNPKKTKTIHQTIKLVVFPVGRLYLALPIRTVFRVVQGVPVSRSGLNQFGVADLGETEITVVDLQQRLFRQESSFDESENNYLIIVETSNKEKIGIEVPKTPAIVEVSTSQIRTLPPSYRRLDTLEIASHVTMISQGSETLTVFLLDTDKILD